MPTEFPLSERQTRVGLLSDPRITVHVRTRWGYQAYRFLVDTGADLSVIPRAMADDLEIDLTRCAEDRYVGIEGRPVTVHQATIDVRIGLIDLSLRCLISPSDAIPFLLGRADVFSRFSITFDNRRKRITFFEI